MTYQEKKAKRFGIELKIVEELRARLEKGDGWTRIRMKDDGCEIDIDLCYGGKYKLSFPPYYGDSSYGIGMPYQPLNRWFAGLDEIAEFLMNKGWQVRWNQRRG